MDVFVEGHEMGRNYGENLWKSPNNICFSFRDMLKRWKKGTRFWNKKWGSRAYFGLQWPPQICPFSCISLFFYKFAGFCFDQNRNSVKQDKEEILKPIFRIFPLLFRKLALQGVYHYEHIPNFYRENNRKCFYKTVRRCILLQVIQWRKKNGGHGVSFPTKRKSLILYTHI